MRPITVTELISLDGVVEAPGQGDHEYAGWTYKNIDFVPEAFTVKGTEQENASAMLLGRVTYQEFANAWPAMDDFALYNARSKYVVTSTLNEPEVENAAWQNCHILRTFQDVKNLRAGDGGPIIVHGSPTLVQALAEADLIDHYTFLQFPVILGRGRRLFSENAPMRKLRLTDSASYSNGIRMSQFDVVR